MWAGGRFQPILHASSNRLTCVLMNVRMSTVRVGAALQSPEPPTATHTAADRVCPSARRRSRIILRCERSGSNDFLAAAQQRGGRHRCRTFLPPEIPISILRPQSVRHCRRCQTQHRALNALMRLEPLSGTHNIWQSWQGQFNRPSALRPIPARTPCDAQHQGRRRSALLGGRGSAFVFRAAVVATFRLQFLYTEISLATN